MQIEQLRVSLTAQPVTAESLPPDITRDWLLPDGRARLQVVPKPATRHSAVLRRFVDEVNAVAPDAGGAAVIFEATSETIIHAFRSAALTALVAIAQSSCSALRRIVDAALVVAPLLLSALITVVVMVLRRSTLNYANIIALPVLHGVGVSFNVYFVMNWRMRPHLGARLSHGPGDPLLGAHHRHRLRRIGAVAPSRHRQHGAIAADQPQLHPHRQPCVHSGAAGLGAGTGCCRTLGRDAGAAGIITAPRSASGRSQRVANDQPRAEREELRPCSGRIPKRAM